MVNISLFLAFLYNNKYFGKIISFKEIKENQQICWKSADVNTNPMVIREAISCLYVTPFLSADTQLLQAGNVCESRLVAKLQ